MMNYTIRLVLVLALAFSAVVSGFATVQAIWPFDQGNSTGNQTGNQSLAGNSSATPGPGQPGYTPPG
jgi:hypothetical protein